MNTILQRVNLSLALLVLVTVVLYFGQPLLTPLFLGALFAMLMAPLCRRLDQKTGRGMASTICTLIVTISLLIILAVGAWQIAVFVDIVIIVCGGLLWGIAGTILFIPLLGIVKIICDHVEPLKPYGFLVGDPAGNKPSKISTLISNLFKKTAVAKKSR